MKPEVELLLLEIHVNERVLSGIIRAERTADGRLILPGGTWGEARLTPAGKAMTMGDGVSGYALEAAAGIVYELDRGKMTLYITAPAGAFEATALSPRSAPAAPNRTPAARRVPEL